MNPYFCFWMPSSKIAEMSPPRPLYFSWVSTSLHFFGEIIAEMISPTYFLLRCPICFIFYRFLGNIAQMVPNLFRDDRVKNYWHAPSLPPAPTFLLRCSAKFIFWEIIAVKVWPLLTSPTPDCFTTSHFCLEIGEIRARVFFADMLNSQTLWFPT